jgi:hypothetical protein
MQNQVQVLVFRTDVSSRRQAERICRQLKQSGQVSRATIDLEDRDRVLRIETPGIPDAELLQILGGLGARIETLD